MRDIYVNPTIARLSTYLEASLGGFVATKREPFHVPSNLAYYTCGALQAAFYAAYALLGILVLDVGYQWAAARRTACSRSTRAASYTPPDRSSC